MEERKESNEEEDESKQKFFLCTKHLMQLSCEKADRHEVEKADIVLIEAIVEQGLCSRRVKPDLQM